MQIGNGFEEVLYRVVTYLIGGAALFLFVQLAIYSTITLRKFRKARDIKKLMPEWSQRIDAYLKGGPRMGVPHLSDGERPLFRDVLVSAYSGSPQDPSEPEIITGLVLKDGQKRRLRILYREMGYVSEDIMAVKEGSQGERSVALGRLSRLQLNDAEDLALEYLDSGSTEEVISCVSYLSSIKSHYLTERLEGLLRVTGRSYRKELLVELTKTDLDINQLRNLSRSRDNEARRFSAVLLGRKGLHFAIPLLKALASDSDPAVRTEAARSLKRLDTPSSLKVLTTMRNDPDPRIRNEVVISLSRKGKERKGPETEACEDWDAPIGQRSRTKKVSPVSEWMDEEEPAGRGRPKG